MADIITTVAFITVIASASVIVVTAIAFTTIEFLNFA